MTSFYPKISAMPVLLFSRPENSRRIWHHPRDSRHHIVTRHYALTKRQPFAEVVNLTVHFRYPPQATQGEARGSTSQASPDPRMLSRSTDIRIQAWRCACLSARTAPSLN